MTGLTLAITTVTTISYVAVPGAAEGALYGTLPVLARNLLLVALFIVMLQELSGLRRAGRPGPWAAGDDEPAPDARLASPRDAAPGDEPVRSSSSA